MTAPENQPDSPTRAIRLGTGGRFERHQAFLDGALEVCSPRGVRGPNLALLQALTSDVGGRVLVVGSREALGAMAVAALGNAEVHDFHFDAFEYERAADSMSKNGGDSGGKVTLSIGADLPGPDSFDWVILALPRTGDSMLAGELVRQAHGALKPRGKILAVTDNQRDKWLHDRVLETFGAVTIHQQGRAGSVYIARKRPDHAPRDRDFRRQFNARVFGQDLQLETRPGVFSHGKLDEGTLAISEIATLSPGARVLDMGAGSGALGVGAARAVADARAVLVDASARAVEVSLANARRNGVADRTLVILACDFACLATSSFDIVLANPPYFGDWQIAAMFAEAGHRVLRPGGQFHYVSKADDVPGQILRELFGGSTPSKRRGYSVLTAVKR